LDACSRRQFIRTFSASVAGAFADFPPSSLADFAVRGFDSMRLAALYDIHGNLPALEAVLEDIRRTGVDEILVGGDVFPGPMATEALALLEGLTVPTHFIKGNGDRVVVAAKAGTDISEVPAAYRDVIGGVRRAWMRTRRVRWQPGSRAFASGSQESETFSSAMRRRATTLRSLRVSLKRTVYPACSSTSMDSRSAAIHICSSIALPAVLV
jgi:hypothetical protein